MLRKKQVIALVMVSIIVALLLATSVFAEVEMYPAKKTAVDWVATNKDQITKVSKAIWNYAELGWQEFKSSAELQDFLKENGFKVERVLGLPTAIVATYGQGKPVIGILGEYDSVAMCSQKAGVPYQDPLVAIGSEVGPGHGCGHNLYGAGSAAAAIAVSKAIKEQGLSGTVKFFGAPAEEILEGKIFMAKEGAFDGTDTMLTWHPGDSNRMGAGSCLALSSVKFSFVGKTAHAGTSPEQGRSALDAVMITDVAANYVREHMVESDRIQCVVTSGGVQPNVIPDYAEIWYFLRAPNIVELKDLLRRLTLCAEAGALASETKMSRYIVTGTWPVLPNLSLTQLGWDNLNLLGIPQWTEEEVNFAKEVQKNAGLSQKGLATTLLPRATAIGGQGKYSTDMGDVSWITPSSSFGVAGNIIGAVGHSWSTVTSTGMEIGEKGMLKAAQVLAASAVDLLTNPELLKEVKEEWEEGRKDIQYETLLGPESKPSLDYFKTEMKKFYQD